MKGQLAKPGASAGSMFRVRQWVRRATLSAIAISSVHALALPIDIREFFFFPDDPVTVGSTDGTAAGSFGTLGESATAVSVILSNDPGLGDPVLINPGEGPALRFSYDFTSDSAADCGDACDTFLVSLFFADLDDPTFNGIVDGLLSEIVATATSAGSVVFSLLPPLATPNLVFGLQFDLLSFGDPAGLGSSVLISALEVFDPNAPPPVTVPEPGSLVLLASGLVALWARRRQRFI